MKRKKRLAKGIESLKKQIGVHEEKLKEAREKGNEDLTRYYEKEIKRFENTKEKKEEHLKK